MRTCAAFGLMSAALLICAVGGCSSGSRGDRAKTPEASAGDGSGETLQTGGMAEANLEAAPGKHIEGKATFTEESDGVLVVLDVDAAPPGNKGVHVHEKADCSDIPGKSMGGHFNPQMADHALPSEEPTHHLGDLGNIVIRSDGKGRLQIKVPGANLQPNSPTSFLGRSIVVHEGSDVGKAEQPAGGSGTPAACGVIEQVGHES
jgi:superoxide dismutase, Cu-Zn family